MRTSVEKRINLLGNLTENNCDDDNSDDYIGF